jgi:hypothetical protein
MARHEKNPQKFEKKPLNVITVKCDRWRLIKGKRDEGTRDKARVEGKGKREKGKGKSLPPFALLPFP